VYKNRPPRRLQIRDCEAERSTCDAACEAIVGNCGCRADET
jgi:hypothetical protein